MIWPSVPDAQIVADTLIERADQALYAAKRAGRNMALTYSELPLQEPAGSLDLNVGEATIPGATLH